MTPEEYLAFERSSEIKHEYFDGELFAMVGAKKSHNLINANLTTNLVTQFRADGSTCRVFSNDMRVRVLKNGKYTYPDIVIACGDMEFEDHELDTLLNPIVIIEILSASTEAYYRGVKFQHYRLIPSLQEYILVSQHACLVEKFVRNNDGTWSYFSYEEMEERLNIDAVTCEVPLSDIYYWIAFEK
ncbi:MAG: Uma2 family endonuclease [Thermodesulfobacteriota bacterium]|nr:Uma2 family endonuclease [Thermodesulfobacteriota bacterium]